MFNGIGYIHRLNDATPKLRGGNSDVYLGRLTKLIPAEALLIYPIGLAGTAEELKIWWPTFVAFLIVVIRCFTTRGSDGKPQFIPIFISLITFILWVYANGDSVMGLEWNYEHADTLTVWGGLFWIAIGAAITKNTS